MAAEFRAAGLTVSEVAGWENRGRPASTGNYDPNGPMTVHHTASTTSPTNPRPTLRTLIVGRPDLPGPLAPFSVDHNGVVIVIAAGRCNHAGRVGKSGILGMPLGADGNALAMGDEVETNGTQGLTDVQRHAMAVAHGVIVKHSDHGPEWAHRHADISGTGKWDIGSLTTQQVRDDIAAAHTQEDDMAYTPEQLAKIIRDNTPAPEKAPTLDAIADAVVKRLLGASVDDDPDKVTVRAALRQASDVKALIQDQAHKAPGK